MSKLRNVLIKTLSLAVFVGSLGFAAPALAATPYLSASMQGNNTIMVSVSNANAFSPVNLSIRQSSSLWTQVNNIGQTDGSGYFSQQATVSSDGSNSPFQLYVTVGGIQSNTATVYPNGSNGCYGSNCNNCNYYNNCGGCNYYNCGSSVSLSQSSLSLAMGQSATVTIYGSSSYSNNFYISNNSNSSVASASISGSSLYVYANQNGSTTLTICQYSGSACATLYVTVSGSNNSYLTLSPSTLNITSAQSGYVYISGGNGSYYISSNSNPSVATASISGNQIYVTGLVGGTTNMTVCSNNSSQCATLYVNINGSNCYYSNCGSLNLSQTSVSLTAGQNTNVTVYGNNGGYLYLSNNSNSSVVSASISGSVIYLNALSAGSATLTICQNSSSQCAYLYVTVTGNSSGTVGLSQTNVSINQGQNSLVTIYNSNANGNGYYISSNTNSNVVSATVSGNTLNLYGSSVGSSNVTVCANNGGSCATAYVTVNGCSYYGCGNNGSSISLSQSSVTLTPNQTTTVNIYGNGGYYYISNNNYQNVANATISGSVITVTALQNGSTTFSVCQSGYTNCANLYVTVSGVLGASTYPNGTLISEYGTVYIVYKNTKTAFANSYAFTGLGYSFGNVINTGVTSLVNSGYTITNINASHPWGSWIKNGNTVYFVHESGIIPVPDWNTFLNNGGQANMIVTANYWDMQRPMLSYMSYNDYRLR